MASLALQSKVPREQTEAVQDLLAYLTGKYPLQNLTHLTVQVKKTANKTPVVGLYQKVWHKEGFAEIIIKVGSKYTLHHLLHLVVHEYGHAVQTDTGQSKDFKDKKNARAIETATDLWAVRELHEYFNHPLEGSTIYDPEHLYMFAAAYVRDQGSLQAAVNNPPAFY